METDQDRLLRLSKTAPIFPVLKGDSEEVVYFRMALTTEQPTNNAGEPVKPLLPPRPSTFAKTSDVACAACGLIMPVQATLHFVLSPVSGRYQLVGTTGCTDCNPREPLRLADDFGDKSTEKVPVDFVGWMNDGKPIPYLDDELFKLWNGPLRAAGDDGSSCWRDINHPHSPGGRWMYKKQLTAVKEYDGKLCFVLATQPYKNRSETRSTKSVAGGKRSAGTKKK